MVYLLGGIFAIARVVVLSLGQHGVLDVNESGKLAPAVVTDAAGGEGFV